MSAPSCLDSALEYAARGWPCLPIWWPVTIGEGARCACGSEACRSVGKHPQPHLCPHGLKNASTDAQTIRAWWRQSPRANVAIVLGETAGLFAVDVDPRHGGDRSMVDLVRDHGPLGETLHAITGSAGDHYFFRWPGRQVTSAANRLGQGLDVKADGGYVVASPSLHASGARYAWARGTPAPEPRCAPLWLLERVLAPAAPLPERPTRSAPRLEAVERAALYLEKMPPAISGSDGHGATMRAALVLVRGFDLSEEDALDLLVHEYNPRCQPPWSVRELRHKVTSAAKAGRVGRGYLLSDGGAS